MQKLHFPITQRAGSATCPDRSQGVRNAKINKKSDRQQGYASGRIVCGVRKLIFARGVHPNKKKAGFRPPKLCPVVSILESLKLFKRILFISD